ncbi:hypothetical protein DMENIID0001_113930 [Sergentomyia squamirostris]
MSSRLDISWEENREALEDFSFFINNEVAADIWFVVGPEKRRIPGHKIYLMSCSKEFSNALCPFRVDRDELPIEDVSYDDFLIFLQYCYTWKINNFSQLNSGTKTAILKLAYRFDMQHLKEICEKEMRISENLSGS